MLRVQLAIWTLTQVAVTTGAIEVPCATDTDDAGTCGTSPAAYSDIASKPAVSLLQTAASLLHNRASARDDDAPVQKTDQAVQQKSQDPQDQGGQKAEPGPDQNNGQMMKQELMDRAENRPADGKVQDTDQAVQSKKDDSAQQAQPQTLQPQPSQPSQSQQEQPPPQLHKDQSPGAAVESPAVEPQFDQQLMNRAENRNDGAVQGTDQAVQNKTEADEQAFNEADHGSQLYKRAANDGTNVAADQAVQNKTNKTMPEFTRLVQTDGGQPKCGILWYYHIPKCGGEAVEQWLFEMREWQQRAFKEVYPLNTWGPDGPLQGVQFPDSRINEPAWEERFIQPFIDNPTNKLIAVHHHDRGPGMYPFNEHLDELKHRLQEKGCDLWRVTFLRKPQSMLTSALFFYDYAEQKDRLLIAPDNVRDEPDQFTRFRTALKTDKMYDNLQIRYLLNNKGEYDGPLPRNGGAQYPMDVGGVNGTALRIAKDILSKFEFVGTSEDLQGGIDHIAMLLNLPATADLRHVNSFLHKSVHQLPEDLQDMISERISMDNELYEFVAQLPKPWKSQLPVHIHHNITNNSKV